MVALTVTAPCLVARAEPPTAPQRSAAAAFDVFREGERAFAAGDYIHAGESFEAAHRLAPHPDALWNAARAWEAAGEAARAANLYARYLRDAPPGGQDRDAAIRSLASLSAKLGRLDIAASGVTDVSVDGRPLDGDRLYVVPGAHVVRGRAGAQALEKTAAVEAGAAASVALAPPATPPAPAASPTVVVVPAPVTTAPPLVRPPFLRRPALIVLIAGSAATAVSAGLLAASAVDTQAARARFDDERTPQNLADGRSKQARTNALLGITAGLGALTLGGTLVLGDWRRAPRAAAGLGLDGGPWLTLHGAF